LTISLLPWRSRLVVQDHTWVSFTAGVLIKDTFNQQPIFSLITKRFIFY